MTEGTTSTTDPADAVRELLSALRELITVPRPALTAAAERAAAVLLDVRAITARAAIDTVLARPGLDVRAADLERLRRGLAEAPVTYTVWRIPTHGGEAL